MVKKIKVKNYKKRKRKKKSINTQGFPPNTKIRIFVFLSVIIIALLGFYFIYYLPILIPVFDGERAYQDIIKQVEFGPRISGSDGHRKAREYYLSTLRKYTDRVEEQKFKFVDRHESSIVYNGINIVASFNVKPEITKRILLCAHYDTRPFADQDPVPTKRNLPVPGANDGASGVAVLLEMARLFSEQKPSIGVDIALFDLEDMGEGQDTVSIEAVNPYAIGSAEFVHRNKNYRPQYGILVDIVGDKNLNLPMEGFSVNRAKPIVDKVWSAASKIGATAFKTRVASGVMDDHVVFLRRNIQVINIIQQPFPDYWHTTQDTPDKCSPESLQQVGDVLVEVVYNEK